MPAVPLSRQNVWSAWMSSRVCGGSANLNAVAPDESTSVFDLTRSMAVPMAVRHRQLAHMALSSHLNAVRIFIGGWSGGIFVSRRDWGVIARDGWSSSSPLQKVTQPQVASVAALRQRITAILDQCAALGMGVILTGNMQEPDGAPGSSGVSWREPGADAAAAEQAVVSARNDLAGFWAQTVMQWGGHPALAGIDILNEPDGPEQPFDHLAGLRGSTFGWPTLVQQVVGSIRQAEVAYWKAAPASRPRFPAPIPIVIGSTGGLATTLSMFMAKSPRGNSLFIDDPAVWLLGDAAVRTATGWNLAGQGANGWLVYSFHYYEPTGLTHQGVLGHTWANLGRGYPAGVSRTIRREHDPQTGAYSDKGWAQSAAALSEEWGNTARRFDNVDDIRREWRTPLALKAMAEQATGRKQPLFVGEFSFVQPVLEAIAPADPARATTTYPDQRSIPVFSNMAWGEHGKYNPRWDQISQHPATRHITRLEVFDRDGRKWVRAFFDNLDRWKFGRIHLPMLGREVLPPAPPGETLKPAERAINEGLFRSGFPVQFADSAKVPKDGSPPVLWPASLFRNTVRMAVTPGIAGTTAAAVARHEAVTVELVADQYWVEYPAPSPSMVSVPRRPLDPATTQYPPVALATFFPVATGAAMDASRERYVLDVLCAAQETGLSWCYFGFDSAPGFIGWRPSRGIHQSLRLAASGRPLPRRI